MIHSSPEREPSFHLGERLMLTGIVVSSLLYGCSEGDTASHDLKPTVSTTVVIDSYNLPENLASPVDTIIEIYRPADTTKGVDRLDAPQENIVPVPAPDFNEMFTKGEYEWRVIKQPSRTIPYREGLSSSTIAVYETSPYDVVDKPDTSIIFIHGGGFLIGYAEATPELSPAVMTLGQDIPNATVYLPNYTKYPQASYEEIVTSMMEATLRVANETEGPVVIGGSSAGGTLALYLSTNHTTTMDGINPDTQNRYKKLLESGRIKATFVTSPPTNTWKGAELVEAQGELPIEYIKNGDCPVAPVYFTYSADIPGSPTTDPVTPAATEALPYIDLFDIACPEGTMYVAPTYLPHAMGFSYNSVPTDDGRPPAVKALDQYSGTPNSLNYPAFVKFIIESLNS